MNETIYIEFIKGVIVPANEFNEKAMLGKVEAEWANFKDLEKIIDSVPNWSADCPFKMELKRRFRIIP